MDADAEADTGAAPRRLGISRHFEGWQLGLVAVAVALCALWLALPRPVEPTLLPLPEVDRRVLARERAEDRARAREAERVGLPFEARALGELVRRHGAAAAALDGAAARQARDDARSLIASVERRHGYETLRQLRALQSELFLQAVRTSVAFRRPDAKDRELEELGGNFVEKAKRSAWVDSSGDLLFREDELAMLFKLRWTELVGRLDRLELRPKLDEFRLYYRALLEHPEAAGNAVSPSSHEQDERRLSYTAALGRIDGDFPLALAQGVLLYRLGRKDQARAAFSGHLAAHQDGPWALRARNYALATLAQVRPTE
jgi:hypothetical protein